PHDVVDGRVAPDLRVESVTQIDRHEVSGHDGRDRLDVGVHPVVARRRIGEKRAPHIEMKLPHAHHPPLHAARLPTNSRTAVLKPAGSSSMIAWPHRSNILRRESGSRCSMNRATLGVVDVLQPPYSRSAGTLTRSRLSRNSHSRSCTNASMAACGSAF